MSISAVETGFKLSPGERMRVIEQKPIPDRSRVLDLYAKSERGIDVYLAHLFGTKKILPQQKADFLKVLDASIETQQKQFSKGPAIETTVQAVLEQNKRATFASFEKATHKEAQIPELTKEDKVTVRQNFLRRYMIKGLEAAASLRDKNNYIHSPFFEEARLKTTILENPDTPEHTAREILNEINMYGLDTVQNYYYGAQEVSKARNETQLKVAFEKWHPSLGNDRIAGYFHKFSQQKLKQIRTGERKEKKTVDQNVRTFYDKFMDTWDYVIDYATPPSMKGPLADVPKGVLKMLFNSRESVSGLTSWMADSNTLRKWFWQLRLGRNVKQFVESEAKKTDKSTNFKRYQEKNVDKMLHSEAAGFDCQTFIESTPQREISPSSALAKTLESLMRYEQNSGLKLKEAANFTVFFGEDSYAKISLPTHFTSSEYLQEQIHLALENAHIQKIDLTARMRAELKYVGYSERREKNADYRKYYGYDDGLTGDYIIQIKDSLKNIAHDTLKPDEKEPPSMFAVDSHKAAVLIDMRKGITGKDGKGRDKVHIKYNHRAFDGLPAKKHFTHVVSELENDTTKWDPVAQIDSGAHFDNDIKYDGNVYPLQEGRALYHDKGVYKKITIKGKSGKDIVISPTLARSLVLGLANDIDYFQLLYAQDPAKTDAEKREYLELNKEFYSDVQPAVVSFNHFKEAYKEWEEKKGTPLPIRAEAVQTIGEWTERLSGSIERAKSGDSDTAVFASVPGSNESILYKVGLAFNSGARLLRDSQGMISPMPDTQATMQRNIIFYTAQSDAYNPDTINLEHPEKNLGVIGYSQEGKKGNAFYTVRKFPGQSQVEFHNAIRYQLLGEDKNPRHLHHTLREMTRLVKMWDGLYRGTNSLSEYMTLRDEVFTNLKNYDVCGEKNLKAQKITDINDFQRYLNDILNTSALNTFSTNGNEKMEKAQKNMYAFFQAMGAKIG